MVMFLKIKYIQESYFSPFFKTDYNFGFALKFFFPNCDLSLSQQNMLSQMNPDLERPPYFWDYKQNWSSVIMYNTHVDIALYSHDNSSYFAVLGRFHKHTVYVPLNTVFMYYDHTIFTEPLHRFRGKRRLNG